MITMMHLQSRSKPIFKTHIESSRWKVRAEVGPFCRKGLRSPAATCNQISFHFKIMSPEITAPLFVLPRWIPLLLPLRLAAIWKILSGRKDLSEIAETQPPAIAFPIRHPAFINHRAS